MTEFTVVTRDLETPYGARITYQPQFPIETGALYLLSIGDLLTVGRYYCDVAGCDWIIQPGLLIRVADSINVEIWGLVVSLESPGGDRTAWSGLSIAAVSVIEIYNLVTLLVV